jgi:hypothetical protein
MAEQQRSEWSVILRASLKNYSGGRGASSNSTAVSRPGTIRSSQQQAPQLRRGQY